ncbi:MAG: hypothetical protein ACUVXH_14175 [Anaerolineae bacterium]
MARSRLSRDLERRTRWAMVAYAFFRWESAVTVAGTILLFFLYPQPFPWWKPWYWLVLGAVGEVALLVASVTDPETGRRVVQDLFRERYNPREIRDRDLRAQMEKALDYRRRIEEKVLGTREGVLREHLMDSARRMDEWVAFIYRLASRLDAYRADAWVAQQLASLPAEIARIRREMREEDDSDVQAQMARTVGQKETQLANLTKLQNLMEQAQYRLEETLAALGTTYSQLLLIGARDVDSGRAQRLDQDMDEQIAALQDIVAALDEARVREG